MKDKITITYETEDGLRLSASYEQDPICTKDDNFLYWLYNCWESLGLGTIREEFKQ